MTLAAKVSMKFLKKISIKKHRNRILLSINLIKSAIRFSPLKTISKNYKINSIKEKTSNPITCPPKRLIFTPKSQNLKSKLN
jgi:hypothetical protein